ncbi:PAS domain S-box protein [Ideonella sp. A 288]|uniref:PAS domain-containing hybrid sensor histidine kinase/response regulator n=1 Tax=Ideonella sp. A 288 TaxID=1962181 RepID=UPI001302F0C4|nr:PAS domain S-box protein [Ideonella sp. A 288]
MAFATAAISHWDHLDSATRLVGVVGELRAREIDTQLREHMAQAQAAASHQATLQGFQRVLLYRDAATAAALREQLRAFAATVGASSVLLLDPEGQVVLTTGPSTAAAEAPPEALRRAVQGALQDAKPHYAMVAGAAGNGSAHELQVAVPLTTPGGGPRGALALRLNAKALAMPHLVGASLPPGVATSQLVWRVGDDLLDADGRRLPQGLAKPDLIAAQGLRGEVAPGQATRGADTEGLAVLGVVHRLALADAVLVTQTTHRSVLAGTAIDAAWIGLTAALALTALVVASRLRRKALALDDALQRQRQQAEQLRSAALVQALVSASPDVIFAKDLAGRYTLFNAGAERATGLPALQVIGRTEQAMKFAGIATDHRAIDRQVLTDGVVQQHREVLPTVDGPREFDMTMGPLRDTTGTVVGLFGVARDITPLADAQAALKASNARLEMALDGAGLGLWEWHVPSGRVDFNERWASMLGFELKDLEPHVATWSDRVHPDDLPGVQAALQPHLDGTTPDYRCEHRVRHRDGHWVWVLDAGRVIERDSAGQPVRAAGIHLDISERKRAEAALAEQRDMLVAMSESARIGAWTLDAQTRQASWTAEIARIHGFAPDALQPPHSYLEFFEGTDRQRLREALAGALEHARPFDIEVDLQPAGLPTRRIRIVGRARQEDGRVTMLQGYLQDITEQHELRQALQDRERLYAAVVEQAADSIALIDIDTGRFVEFNESAHRNLGYSREEFAQMGVADIDHRFPREAIASGLKAMQYPNSMVLDTMHRHRDGSSRHAQVSGRIVSVGRQRYLAVIWIDITARKAAETALRDERGLLQRVIETMTEGMLMLDAGRRYSLANPAAAAILGVPREQVLGRHYLDVPWQRLQADGTPMPDERSPWLRALQDSETLRNVEMAIVRPDGSICQLITSVTPLHDESGVVTGAVAVISDVTERQQALKELHKLSLAVSQSPESIVITDREARIEYVNEAFEKVSGYRAAEVLGRNPRLLQSGRTPPEAVAALWDTLAQGRTWKGQFWNRRKDGTEYTEFAIVSPLRDESGQITHYVGVKEDVTEKQRIGAELEHHRHHLEELVSLRTAELAEARQRAEAASQAKSRFLANMSHEIRTPMNAILGLVQLARRDGNLAAVDARLERIGQAGKHLMSILNDILDMSKIEAGRMQVASEDFSLATLLGHVRSLVSASVQAKQLRLDVETGGVPDALRGDPARLRQALLNYVANAVKFTDAGTVTVRVTAADTGVPGEHRGVSPGEPLHEDTPAAARGSILLRFEVQDTGVGIAPAALAQLFNEFEQADASTTRHHGGTGLGLAITRRMAALMGGEAGAHSERGRGSTFWFTAQVDLAMAPGEMDHGAEADAGHDEQRLRQHHAGARILVVEDHPVNREIAVDMLDAVGMHVDVAVDGMEALEWLQQHPCDLVLMDMQMPRMDGLQATRAIRRLPGLQSLPVLAMTANAFDADRQACRDACMNDFIAKPVDPAQLYGAVQRWLARSGHVGLPPADDPDDAPASSRPPAREPSPASLADDRCFERLLDITGLDAPAGLQRLDGKLSAYLRVLGSFLRLHGGDAALLQQAWQTGDQQTLAFLAHRLRGAAASLCATAVADAAAALDEALKRADSGRGASPDTRVTQLIDEIEHLMAALRAVELPG